MQVKLIAGCLMIFGLLLTACGGSATPTPTVELLPTMTSTPPGNPTRTPVSNIESVPPTAIVITSGPVISGANNPTSVAPASTSNLEPIPGLRLLQNGRGISSGRPLSDGEFEVETYCSVLNPDYGVFENGTDWLCTFRGQPAVTLRLDDFTEICRRNYNNPNAIAVQHTEVQPLAYAWRCYEYTFVPSATPAFEAQLLQNGRGLSTGNVMNDGNFEVEVFCSLLNPDYGIEEDGNRWYCTQNGARILPLGTAEFDDICFRTYSIAGAFSEQIPGNEPAAYRWRCYAYPHQPDNSIPSKQ